MEMNSKDIPSELSLLISEQFDEVVAAGNLVSVSKNLSFGKLTTDLALSPYGKANLVLATNWAREKIPKYNVHGYVLKGSVTIF